MVFHSLDKITSVFIHLSPSLLMYGLRWKWHGTLSLPDDFTVWVQFFYLLSFDFFLHTNIIGYDVLLHDSILDLAIFLLFHWYLSIYLIAFPSIKYST